jgi:nitroimidazol reductase NimA-like FMN-containing flavoprotein (pyridoxamine 5'-phosphate oxidase superfamily)
MDMSETVGEAMDDVEIGRFLRNRGLGVLGLAADGEAYTIPIAFAYDEESRRCIFRFLATEDSEKMAFVSRTEIASLTAYEWGGPADWRSVVLRGPLSRLADDDMAQAAALFADLGAEAALDVFTKPVSAYETGWYELQIEECTGRGGFE